MKKGWIGWAENFLIAAVGVGLVAAAFAVLSGNWQVQPVLSGSMRPALDPGGVIIVQRVPISEVKVGDVIVFHRPDQSSMVVAHRVIAATVLGDGLQVSTKGDANSVADEWSPFLLRGPNAYVVRSNVPLVGYAAVGLRRYGVPVAAFLGAASLIYLVFRQLRPARGKEQV
jgi:signal peptidase